MYRHCIYCSAELGANEALERFPVGRTLAFDADKGRLWAVCRRCARWNLAPIEERWEPVEAAERAFRDSRLKVQAENMGVARLRDGTRLVRIGQALPAEVATWRYGGELWRRRRGELTRGTVTAAAAAVTGGAAFLVVGTIGGVLLGTGAVVGAFLGAGQVVDAVERGMERVRASRAERQPVYRLGPADSPTGEEMVLRREDLRGSYLAAEEGEVALHVPSLGPLDAPGTPLTFRGWRARSVLSRAMVRVNAAGAAPSAVGYALDELDRAGSPEAYLARVAEERTTLELPRDASWHWLERRMDPYWTRRAELEGVPAAKRDEWMRGRIAGIAGEGYGGLVRGLALEVALHEAAEREALRGELTLLESAWREAEALADIADRLAVAPKSAEG